jgi:hypothetical protein
LAEEGSREIASSAWGDSNSAAAPVGRHDFLIPRAGNQQLRSGAGLQPWQPMAAAGAAEKNRPLVAHDLTATAGENKRMPDQARPTSLAAAGEELPHAAAVWGHAAKDCGGPITSKIGEPQTETEFGTEPKLEKKSV